MTNEEFNALMPPAIENYLQFSGENTRCYIWFEDDELHIKSVTGSEQHDKPVVSVGNFSRNNAEIIYKYLASKLNKN